VQLRNIETDQIQFLQATNFNTNSCSAAPLNNFAPGYAIVTVFVNGIPSPGTIINISAPVPTIPVLTSGRLSGGVLKFNFTNSPGALFTGFTTSNLTVPASNWTVLGGVVETSPGQFQFTDPEPPGIGPRYYRVRSQ
jgi:hypothetical protein